MVPTDALRILWRGLAMGAADIIPGVSGGTIAFITGIYDRLVTGIRDGVDAVLAVGKERSPRPLRRVDWSFFLPLGIGIVAAFGVGSLFIPHLLEAFPGPVYSFFIGLILASAIVVFRKVDAHSWTGVAAGLVGVLIGTGVGLFGAAQHAPSLLALAVIGMVAASAMLLPGVSGSFILLLFGAYEYMLHAIAAVDLPVIAVFAAGAVLGLALLSHLLGWLLREHPDPTYYWLAGLMLGALQRPLAIVGEHTSGAGWASATGLLVVGAALVLLLERFGSATPDRQQHP